MASIDLGDLVLDWGFRVKCCPRLKLVWHIGPTFDTGPEDRVIKPPPYSQPTGRIDVVMDLQADQQVPLSLTYTDEVGNPLPTPTGATVTYTVDDPTIINLTDNGDGTAVAAAVGTLGSATVHVEATVDGGTPLTGDLLLVVVAGLAERVEIVAGPPEEVTPDV
jgi:hypothetical protein